MNNTEQKFAIVKLMKNNTVEYPITRPECVMFTDGTTAASHFELLEDGVRVLYLSYKTGYDNNHINNGLNPPMFNDESVFHAYHSISIDSVKRQYDSIRVPHPNRLVTFPLNDSVDESSSDYGLLEVVENEGDVPKCFTIKHFSSLMYGYAPKNINETHNKLIYLDVDIINNTMFSNFGGDGIEFAKGLGSATKALKLVMGVEGEPNDSSNVYTLYFVPTYNLNGSVVCACYMYNPVIYNYNNI